MIKEFTAGFFFYLFFFSSYGIGLGVFSGGVRRCVADIVIPCGFVSSFFFVCLEMHFMVGERCCWLRP
jgi:hypothetical protein